MTEFAVLGYLNPLNGSVMDIVHYAHLAQHYPNNKVDHTEPLVTLESAQTRITELEEECKLLSEQVQLLDIKCAALENEYQFEVWQDDDCVASGSASTKREAEREAMNYAAQYSLDGPVKINLFVRHEIYEVTV